MLPPSKPQRPTQRYMCTLCSKSFSSDRGLKYHFDGVHLGRHPYHCPYCNRGYTGLKDVRTHICSRHSHGLSGFVCLACREDLGTLPKLRHHLQGCLQYLQASTDGGTGTDFDEGGDVL